MVGVFLGDTPIDFAGQGIAEVYAGDVKVWPITTDGDPFFDSVIVLHHFEDNSLSTGDPTGRFAQVLDGAGVTLNGTLTGVGELNTEAFFNSRLAIDNTDNAISLGTGDLTFEIQVEVQPFGGLNQFLWDTRPDGVNGDYSIVWINATTGQLRCFGLGGSDVLAGGEIIRIAFSRVSGVGYLFVDGILQSSAPNTVDYLCQPSAAQVGTNAFAISDPSSGVVVDELRVTKGVGRYTTNHTPPPLPFPDS